MNWMKDQTPCRYVRPTERGWRRTRSEVLIKNQVRCLLQENVPCSLCGTRTQGTDQTKEVKSGGDPVLGTWHVEISSEQDPRAAMVPITKIRHFHTFHRFEI